ncbi:hypothetical protein E2C01_084245 [Portunus trituberculatus]|uniref:Uncharacterized protein n=1 Tax=Portunus trituberculatus TaxID=210409 RepID=A0A5B7J3I0_PORTR|nr:hypothetical protein [Portunus trituberculatus]
MRQSIKTQPVDRHCLPGDTWLFVSTASTRLTSTPALPCSVPGAFKLLISSPNFLTRTSNYNHYLSHHGLASTSAFYLPFSSSFFLPRVTFQSLIPFLLLTLVPSPNPHSHLAPPAGTSSSTPPSRSFMKTAKLTKRVSS